MIITLGLRCPALTPRLTKLCGLSCSQLPSVELEKLVSSLAGSQVAIATSPAALGGRACLGAAWPSLTSESKEQHAVWESHTKCSTFTIFKCTAGGIKYIHIAVLTSHRPHPSPEFFSSCKTETLSVENNSLLPLLTTLDNHFFISCIDPFGWVWLFSLSITSSRVIHVVASARISFLVKAE